VYRTSQWIFVLIACSFAPFARAANEYDVALDVGKARFFGDLSSDQNAPMVALSTSVTQRLENSRWGLGVHVIQATTSHFGDSFPFEKDADLSLLSFFFTPVICSLGDIYVCAALGNGTVNVNSSRYRQDYGSWTYHANVSTQFLERWALTFGVKYIGRVEQQIQDKKTEFSFLSILLGLTYGSSNSE